MALSFTVLRTPRTLATAGSRMGWRERIARGQLAARPVPEWAWLALLLTIVTVTWCAHYDIWSRESWSRPALVIADERWARAKAAFGGDALWGMAASKAMAEGEIGFFSKQPASLGAPFASANWNDWLSVEEGLTAWWAFHTRLFGLFAGSNVTLLWAHLLAAASFYLVCRYFRYHHALALAGAALFALSRYAFWRGLPHLGLLMYWHIPLGFVVLWWCLRGEPVLEQRKKLFFSLGVAVLHGMQSPYYGTMFLQLLFGATLCALVRSRDWRKVLPGFLIAVTLLLTFVSMNLDTFLHRFWHGASTGTVAPRSYADAELWALKPVELFLPFSHAMEGLERWAQEAYFTRALIMGEGGSAYLGVVSICALGWLLWSVVKGYARQKFEQIPPHFWCVLWVLGFSIVGGMVGLLGLGNLFLVRATNRFSIYIMAAGLLFLVKRLTEHTRPWRSGSVWALGALLLAVGIYDQVPPAPAAKEREATWKMFKADKKLVAVLESKLPDRAMVFQLPVLDFPEGFAIEKMVDYEPFRPFLHSKHLRFSYGENRGRFRERWQREADSLGGAALVRKLERYGFSAILINRKGYPETHPAQENLRAAGRSRVLASSKDYLCIELNPRRRPSLPPEFREGWYALEGHLAQNIRWSSGDATLVLHNGETGKRSTKVTFDLTAHNYRYLELWTKDRLLYHGVINPQDPRPVVLRLKLDPGENKLRFLCEPGGEVPPNGDPRMLAFALVNFSASR